jgi:hypothetical protein
MKSDRVRHMLLLALCGLVAVGFGVRERAATMPASNATAAVDGTHPDDAHARTVAMHRDSAPHEPAPASHVAGAANAGKATTTPHDRLAALRTPLALESANNPFAASSWLPPPPPPVEVPAAAVPVAPPTAPPIPFTYLGELDAKTGKPQVFLSNGDRLLIVSPGEVVDGQYRVDAISETDVVLTYLPLNQRQTISTQSKENK